MRASVLALWRLYTYISCVMHASGQSRKKHTHTTHARTLVFTHFCVGVGGSDGVAFFMSLHASEHKRKVLFMSRNNDMVRVSSVRWHKTDSEKFSLTLLLLRVYAVKVVPCVVV